MAQFTDAALPARGTARPQVGPQTATNDDIAICTVLAQTYIAAAFRASGNGSVVDLSPLCRPVVNGVATLGGICNGFFNVMNYTQLDTSTNTPFGNEFCLTENSVLTNGDYLLKRQQSFLLYLAPYDTDNYECVSGGPTLSVPSPSYLATADSGVLVSGAYPVPVTSLVFNGILNSGSITACKVVPKKVFLLKIVLGVVLPSLAICGGVAVYRKRSSRPAAVVMKGHAGKEHMHGDPYAPEHL